MEKRTGKHRMRKATALQVPKLRIQRIIPRQRPSHRTLKDTLPHQGRLLIRKDTAARPVKLRTQRAEAMREVTVLTLKGPEARREQERMQKEKALLQAE